MKKKKRDTESVLISLGILKVTAIYAKLWSSAQDAIEKLEAENKDLRKSLQEDDILEIIKNAIGGCNAFMKYEHCSKESKGDFKAIKKTLEKALKY